MESLTVAACRRGQACTRTMTGGALLSPAGSTSPSGSSADDAYPLTPDIRSPGISPLVAYIIQPFVAAVAAGCARRRELHLATLFSRTYTHTHRDVGTAAAAKELVPDSLFSHRGGYTPIERDPRRAARYLRHLLRFFSPIYSDFFLPLSRSLSLSPSLSPTAPAGASSPPSRLPLSHSFRSRPYVCMSRARRTPLLRPLRYVPVNTKHAGRRTAGYSRRFRNEIARRGVDVLTRRLRFRETAT